ncbi:MAG: response regulator [Deltaproteobacteria bacterium]|nr:response regulator [Deltaproteobacteria bacterium]
METLPVKALFVDDEENILKSLRRLLADEDMEVLTATSGEQGLEILRSNGDIGLIVSDQRMPGLTGVDFLREARDIAPDALRIMLTGYADISATIDAINKGGTYRYISKPWDDEELVMTIREALRHYRLTTENRRLWGIVNRQNEELREWNDNLKNRVMEQTASLRVRIHEFRDLNDKLKKNYDNIIMVFSGLIELHDRETRNHCRNVSEVSVTAAEKLGLQPEVIESIKVAALLHDIGKIGMPGIAPDPEIDGGGRDTTVEYRLHPVRGQSTIDSIDDLRAAGELIRHHHESYDGSGFPDALSGTEIPLGSRIIALADAFDTGVSDNPADNACEMACISIGELLGTRFDPELYSVVAAAARDKYRRTLERSGMVEMELSSRELRRGMIVAHEVRSGTGLLLLGKGEVLDEIKIAALKRYYVIDPPVRGVPVLVRKELCN